MIKSMTGYGYAKENIEGLEITVELKSVNNRYLDCSSRLPRGFLFVEDALKTAVGEHISRGKVDVFVSIDVSASDDTEVIVNEALLKSYMSAISHIAEEYGISNDMTALSVSRIPEILNVTKKEMNQDAVKEGILRITEKALCDFDEMRGREGKKLEEDVLSRLDTIENYVCLIEAEAPNTVSEYRLRLQKKMEELLGSASVDENRIISEAALFADKIAIDEETVRLRSHMAQMKTMLETGSPIGKKLDFLIQEFNRESNTICSKCQNSQVTHVAVDLKSEIEKIREQIQNIE